jgi:hypothetical protein
MNTLNVTNKVDLGTSTFWMWRLLGVNPLAPKPFLEFCILLLISL